MNDQAFSTDTLVEAGTPTADEQSIDSMSITSPLYDNYKEYFITSPDGATAQDRLLPPLPGGEGVGETWGEGTQHRQQNVSLTVARACKICVFI